MPSEKTEVLIVGAGQAGLAMSAHLKSNDIPHLVLERERIAERWRTGRWDSLVANGPAWHDRFPPLSFPELDPEDFAGKDRIADYFVEFAQLIDAPVRCGVAVEDVRRNHGGPGFCVKTSAGEMTARYIVAATGPFQKPVVPPIVPNDAPVHQLHSFNYRNPDQLPQGAVLVVGGGASGVQIAEEIRQSGRNVYLSVGKHDRPPRRYRGHDYGWWLGVLGLWDVAAPTPGTEHVTIAVTGANGGHTVDFRRLAEAGITLVGITTGYQDGMLTFAENLKEDIARGDANFLSVLDQADEYVKRNGLDLPEEPEARDFAPDPDCVRNPIAEIDIEQAGITTILWATGYALDYQWLNVDAFDAIGKPQHTRGVSSEPGVYFLGLPWLSRRGSSFIWGVWHDAKHIADQIGIQRNYLKYDAEKRS